MSLESDIFSALLAVYPKGLTDITNLSYNVHDKRDFILSNEKGFNFDLVHNLSMAYTAPQKEKTPDGLFLVNDMLFFVEFKEGGHNKQDIRLKIHEAIVSLYMFTSVHMPHVSRNDFFSLKISYAVIARPPAKASEFQTALTHAREKYQLENLHGFILRKTNYSICPNITARLIKNLTSGAATFIEIQQRDGTIEKVTA